MILPFVRLSPITHHTLLYIVTGKIAHFVNRIVPFSSLLLETGTRDPVWNIFYFESSQRCSLVRNHRDLHNGNTSTR